MKSSNYLLGLCLFIIFSIGCKSDFVKVTQKSPDGFKEIVTLRKSDQKKHGVYKRFDDNNKLVEIANYKNGVEEGERIFFYENGDTASVETHVNGRFEGPYREYYKGGKLNIKYLYVNNKIQGPAHHYYKSGQLMEVVQFADNLENGPFTEYYENGNLKAEGTYLNGDSEHGELKLYDKNGELEKKMNCDKGICHTVWKSDKSQ